MFDGFYPLFIGVLIQSGATQSDEADRLSCTPEGGCSSVPVIETPLMGFIPFLVHLIDAGGEGILHDFRLNKYSLNMDSGRAGVPDFSFFLALV